MPTPFDPEVAPDQALVHKQEETLDKTWRDAHAAMRRADAFYTLQYDPWERLTATNPDEAATRPMYRSPMATAIVDHAAESFMALLPRFHKSAVGEGKAHEEKADRVEKALQEIFQDAFLWLPAHPPRVSAIQLLLYNYAQLYVGLRSEALEAPPEREAGESAEDFDLREFTWEASRSTRNPFHIEATSPTEVLMDPTEITPGIAIRRRKYYAYQLHAITTTKAETLDGVKVFDLEGNPYTEVKCTEWWSAQWYVLAKGNGEIIYKERNKWGFQPFLHTFGVGTVRPIDKEFNPKDLVRKGILFSEMDTLMMRDQAYMGHHELLQRTAWARVGNVGDASEAAEQLKGKVLSGEEKDWWLEKVPTLPQVSFEHKRDLDLEVERTTYSLQAAGFRQSGVDTATQQIILSEKTDRKFALLVAKLGHLYSLAAMNVLKLAKAIAREYPLETIMVGEFPLKVGDIEDYRVIATFDNIDQVAFQQEKVDARAELQAGLMSRKRYWRVTRVEDATGEEKEIIKDLVREMPEVQAELKNAALKEMGFGDLAAQRERQARLAAMVGPDGKTPLFPGAAGVGLGGPGGIGPAIQGAQESPAPSGSPAARQGAVRVFPNSERGTTIGGVRA